MRCALPQPGCDGGSRRREPRGLRRAVGFLYICLVRELDDGQSARPDHGRVHNAWDDRNSVQNRARCGK